MCRYRRLNQKSKIQNRKSAAWVVHSQAAGDGRHAVKYLSNYVLQVAISDHRLVSCADTPDGQGQVTYTTAKAAPTANGR